MIVRCLIDLSNVLAGGTIDIPERLVASKEQLRGHFAALESMLRRFEYENRWTNGASDL